LFSTIIPRPPTSPHFPYTTLFRSSKPLHPYTKGLMRSIPQLDSKRGQKLHVIEGSVPSLENVPSGCRFASRCAFATDLCLEKNPELETKDDGRKVRCWHAEEIALQEEEKQHVKQ